MVVKIVALFLSLTFALFASPLNEKIESFLGKNEFHIQKNLIDIIFKDKDFYYNDLNRTDDLKILVKLKENGLLKLFYNSPVEMNIRFTTFENSLIFMSVINESLEAMGYSYFITDQVLKENEKFSWKIKLSTEHILDPTMLAKEFAIRGCSVVSIKKEGDYDWSYDIDTSKIQLRADKFDTSTTVNLKKPIKSYWIDIEDAKSISLRSKLADRWYPNVVFYDKNLGVLSFYRKDEVVNSIKLEIPKNAKYVKIGDIYNLENIKRGLSLYLVSK